MKVPLWLVLAALCAPALPLEAQTAATRTVECGTDSRQRVLCAAGGKVVSAKLVRDLSFNRCGAAGSWGWTGNAIWVDNSCRGQFQVTLPGGADSAARRGTITCGSLSARREECRTEGPVDSVRVVKQGTFARCREGSNWGHSDSLVWAGNGCRAEFEVVYRRAAPKPLPAPAPARPVTRTITCGLASGQFQTCRTDGQVDTVRLVRDLSGSTCRQKVTWSYARTFIWTKDGCRGQFEVTYRDTLAAGAAPKPIVRRITCGEYSGRQVTCRTEGPATTVRLVRDYTGNRCKEGSNWGHTDAFVWTSQGCRGDFEVTYRDTTAARPGARRVTCGTNSNAQVQCNPGGELASVRVLRNLGDSTCRERANWRYADRTIWAGRGCRAEFEVTFGSDTTAKLKPVPPATRVVSCGNASGSAMSCNAFGTVATVRLQRDQSGGRCGQPGSWGLNDEAIWVARGCYGDFEVTYAGSGVQ